MSESQPRNRHQRVKSIFNGALDLPPEQRASFLDAQCGDDPELRAEVEALLAHHDAKPGTGSLGQPAGVAGAAGPTAVPQSIQAMVGTTVGNYRILDILGMGGMGVVFRAEQEHPRRTVALKVINAGVASGAALRRFEHEAEILGQLQHPGIAQIFEAGTFDGPGGAQPYFAMELVQGQSLTEYAAARKLDIRQKLELLARICRAVQHAHQKGVIHRDLKPGNILVVDEEGQGTGDGSQGSGVRTQETWLAVGQPKILDFGVARATDSDVHTTTLQTDIGQLIGTVPYMSPEQAGGDPKQLDTRSDVYALGVIAYELLTGRLPYELRNRMILEAVRIIREEEPTRLSSISRTLRGDIEIMVGKALAKEKDRRYQSALDFASDIDRYLQDQPIVARPPSAAYQLRKFTRRNKVLVGGIAAVFIVLTAGLIGTTGMYLQAEEARAEAVTARDAEAQQRSIAEENEQRAVEEAQRAEREAERALAAEADAKQRADELELVSEFQASQLADIDTALMGTRIRRNIIEKRRATLEAARREQEEIEQGLRELEQSLAGVNFTNVALETLDENIFERALRVIDEKFAEQPLIRARLLQTLATTLHELGLLSRAEQPQQEALAIRRRLLGDEHPDTLASISTTGVLQHFLGNPKDALPLVHEALEGRRKTLGDHHPDTLASIANLGALFRSLGRFEEALLQFEEALGISMTVFGEEHPDTIAQLGNMGAGLWSAGRFDEAKVRYRQAVDKSRQLLGPDHRKTLRFVHNLGVLLESTGREKEALPYLLQALDSRRRILGDDHPETLQTIGSIGVLYWSMGSIDDALPFLREALEKSRRVLGSEHPDTLKHVGNKGMALASRGMFEDAEPLFREAMETGRRLLGDEHPEVIDSINNMGVLLGMCEEYEEALVIHRQALELRLDVLGDEHPSTLTSVINVGGVLRSLGRFEEAEPYSTRAVEMSRRMLGHHHPNTLVAIRDLGVLLADLNRFAEAELLLIEALDGTTRRFGSNHSQSLSLMETAAAFYGSWHKAAPGAGYDEKETEMRARLKAERESAKHPAPDGEPSIDGER